MTHTMIPAANRPANMATTNAPIKFQRRRTYPDTQP